MNDSYPAYIQHPEDPGKKIYIPEEEQNEFWSNLIEHYVKNEATEKKEESDGLPF